MAILVISGKLASHARVLGAFAIPATIPWLLGFFMTRWLSAIQPSLQRDAPRAAAVSKRE